MPSEYVLSHSSGPSGTHPTMYLIVEQVASPQSLKHYLMERPETDIRGRKRAKRNRRITLIGTAAQPAESGLTGLNSGAGLVNSTGLQVFDALENALLNWHTSGTTTLQVGVNGSGAAKTYTGFIENIDWHWKPDKDDAPGVRRFTLTFVIGTVT